MNASKSMPNGSLDFRLRCRSNITPRSLSEQIGKTPKREKLARERRASLDNKLFRANDDAVTQDIESRPLAETLFLSNTVHHSVSDYSPAFDVEDTLDIEYLMCPGAIVATSGNVAVLGQ
jgi:hypothetical protein